MLQRVQNRALWFIYILEWCSFVDMIHDISNLPLVKVRLIDIRKSFEEFISFLNSLFEFIMIFVKKSEKNKSFK